MKGRILSFKISLWMGRVLYVTIDVDMKSQYNEWGGCRPARRYLKMVVDSWYCWSKQKRKCGRDAAIFTYIPAQPKTQRQNTDPC